ncbi:flagellar M-ring protein FliF [Belnapia sp. T6]|uniref:Flagellar M-ring protein n=2 Tax=Belnapia mucosa TaxID=2804532 RepID=A0ABS1VA02_9PROT|nr:flagellar M-ring protein FliF [Belnapia mucosa]
MAGLLAGLRGLGPLRLAALAAVALGILGLIGALAFRAGEPAMSPLFGELESRDAAAVVAALERQRVPYRLAGGGSTVLAPVDQVPRLRLLLAREGLPSGGGVGWEIFDRSESLTTSPFQQDVNRLRALEGELARTIRGLAGVRTARVHLVLPRREAFSRERGEAQASVVLAMQGAQRLDREGVQAVLHLVATAVPGLKPQHVSIVDSRGELLARGGQALAGPAQALNQEELRRAQEMRIGRAVEELLERTLGPGRVRAEATVELDFDRVETREERFDPENQVPRSTQSVTEQNRGAEPPPTSVATNLPGQEATSSGGGASSESRQEETTNYEIGRSSRNVLREHPVLKRLSVAVLVDGLAENGAWRERTPEELARIAALVRSAVGFDERRGDRVEVVSMRFVEEAGTAPEAPSFLGLPVSPALGTRLVESALLALVALVAILLLGRPMVGRLLVGLGPQPALAMAGAGGAAMDGMEGAPGLPPSEGGAALAGPDDPNRPASPEAMIDRAQVEGQVRASAINNLVALVQEHPEEALSVLRRWLAPEDAT